jgi:deferrochelatase/peroxidase EfeB
MAITLEVFKMQLDSVSYAAYKDGVENGTIKDSEQEIVRIVQEQEVVSYCSKYGSYTFDYMDLCED